MLKKKKSEYVNVTANIVEKEDYKAIFVRFLADDLIDVVNNMFTEQEYKGVKYMSLALFEQTTKDGDKFFSNSISVDEINKKR